MTMLMPSSGKATLGSASSPMTKLEAFVLNRETKTYVPYYNGKMSYALSGEAWKTYISEAFPDLKDETTSENIFKAVIDLYAESLIPQIPELRNFSNVLPALLMRGECPVLVGPDGTAHYPEHFEMLSDGNFTITALFTRNLEKMTDNVVFAYSNGRTRLFSKPVPDDFTAPSREGYKFIEEKLGNTLFRFDLDDKGFGASLAALQDRLNHSIIDLTVVAEMYARPFWYLMNVQMPPKNPFLPATSQAVEEAMEERKVPGATGRIFTTSSEGPFGQLTPPTIGDMIGYHDSIMDKISTTTGIPQHYFKPGSGTPPTGVALKVLTKRFNTKVARIRDDIRDTLEELATLLGIPKNATEKDADGKETPIYEFWSDDDDLMQEAKDAHGIALSTMGYPLEYIAEVVTPGVDLDDYEEEGGLPGQVPPPGQPVDMTAMGQTGTPATPGQVAAYERNPGQRARS